MREGGPTRGPPLETPPQARPLAESSRRRGALVRFQSPRPTGGPWRRARRSGQAVDANPDLRAAEGEAAVPEGHALGSPLLRADVGVGRDGVDLEDGTGGPCARVSVGGLPTMDADDVAARVGDREVRPVG